MRYHDQYQAMDYISHILEEANAYQEQEKCEVQKEVRRTQKILSDLNF